MRPTPYGSHPALFPARRRDPCRASRATSESAMTSPLRARLQRRFRVISGVWMFVIVVGIGLPVSAQTATTSEPLAVVNGEAITVEEVENALGAPLRRLERQIYDMKRQKLEALIGERVLAREAAKRGISVQALPHAEVTAKAGLVSEQEVETFFQANKGRLKGEEADVRKRIAAHFQQQKLAVRRETFLQSLRSQARVVVHLQAPPVFRPEVTVGGAPFRGPAAAPRSEEHTSELQSLAYLVCRLLLEKKKKKM